MKTETLSFKPLSSAKDRYVINSDGDVKSIMRKTINSIGRSHTCKGGAITPVIDRAGYWTVNITIGGLRSTRYVHRLVAQTYLDNPENKPFVNHKNGIKLDNRVENLEWVTSKENYLHAVTTGLCKAGPLRKIPVLDRCTGILYSSIRATSFAKNIPYEEIKFILKHDSHPCLKIVDNAGINFNHLVNLALVRAA